MRHFFIFLLLIIQCSMIQAQVEHLAELPIESSDVNYNYYRNLSIYSDGDFVIMPHIKPMASAQETVLFNKTTNELTVAPVFVMRQHEVFGSKVYLIKQGSNSLRYAKLLPGGNFQTVPDPIFIPSIEHDGKVYGREATTIYSASTDGTDIRAIAELPFPTGSRSSYSVVGDSIFFAAQKRLVVFHISDSTYHEYDPTFMEEEGLTYLPRSKHNDRFIYLSEKNDSEILFYELGPGIGRRFLGSTQLESNLSVINSSGNNWLYLHSDAVVSKNNMTYLALWANQDNWPLYTNLLIKLDRSEAQPAATLIHTYRRDNKIRLLSNRLFISNEGKLVAQGLFGSEGIENYGVVNGQLKVLSDFIPGSHGSLDWFLDFHHLSDGNTETRVKKWNDQIWSLAAHPHYGMEITYSDGTEKGTKMLSDLVEGAQGIAYFDILDDGNIAYVYAQHDDESYHLYRIGPQVPSFESIESSPYWSKTLGSYPEYHISVPPFYLYKQNVVNLVDDPSSNGIYSLTPKGKAGSMIGDSINPFYRGAPDVYRIQKLNRQTGEIEWSTMFNLYGFEDDAELAVDYEGKIHMLRFCYGEYQNEQSILNEEQPDWELTDYGIFLYTFTSEGQLEQIRPISDLNESASLIHFGIDDQDNISYVLRYSNRIQYTKSTTEGTVISSKSIATTGSQSATYFEQIGNYYAASVFNPNHECTNCIARLYLLNASFEVIWSELIEYTGRISKPRLLPAFDDEIWLSCGGNGKLSIGSQGFEVKLGEQNYFQTKALLQRYTKHDKVLLSSRIIDDDILDYLGTYRHNESIIMAYISRDSSLSSFPFHYSLFPNQAKPESNYLRLVQLDQLGQEKDYYNIPAITSGSNSGFTYRPIMTNDNQWIFAIYAQSQGRVHVDTLTPPPLFARSIFRVQIVNREWPFEVLPQLRQNAVKNEYQNFADIYPNPTNGQIYIVPNGGNLLPFDRLEIYDMQGRFLYEERIPENINFLNFDLSSRLNAGKYVLQLVRDSKVESHQIVLIK